MISFAEKIFRSGACSANRFMRSVQSRPLFIRISTARRISAIDARPADWPASTFRTVSWKDTCRVSDGLGVRFPSNGSRSGEHRQQRALVNLNYIGYLSLPASSDYMPKHQAHADLALECARTSAQQNRPQAAAPRPVLSITDEVSLCELFHTRQHNACVASTGRHVCFEPCAAYTSWPAGQERTIRTVHGTAEIGRSHTARRRAELPWHRQATPRMKCRPACRITSVEATVLPRGGTRYQDRREITRCRGSSPDAHFVNQPEDPQLTPCLSARS
ncbi:hypothetical protein ACVINW_003955 [Bradyrhizobium sp. USDA 4461]